MKRLFRGDPRALTLLRGLETGELAEEEFERRFAELLGVDEAADLIEGMFAGCSPTSRWSPRSRGDPRARHPDRA